MTKQVQRRRGTATQHTSFTGAEGEVSVNTTNKSVHVHDGVTAGGIEGARADLTNVSDSDLNARLTGNTLSSLTITSADINGGTIDGTVIGGTTPAAGNFTTGSFTGNVSFGDNDKAIFGAGSDLQIYHNGSNSYIEDAGTGSLIFRSSTATLFQGKTAGENQLTLVENGAVTAYYDNAARLATTSTGIDVTGTVTADGLTVDGSLGDFQVNTGGNQLSLTYNGNNYINSTGDGSALNFRMKSSYTQAMKINGNGDISFYEDTGTTPKFHWSASAEILDLSTGLTVGSPSNPTSSKAVVKVADSASAIQAFEVTNRVNADFVFKVESNLVTGGSTIAKPIAFMTSNTERMRIDSSGNVGIGTTSPVYPLDVAAPSNIYARFASSNSASELTITSPTTNIINIGAGSGDDLSFSSNATERMRIDSSGNVLVGGTSSGAAQAVTISGTGGYVQARAASSATGFFDRLTTDGDITVFRKDGSTVGSIGVTGSGTQPYFVKASTGGFKIGNDASTALFLPVNADGSNSDGGAQLGTSSNRFKDLYLSGGVYLGGTGAANKLDDYEEGTWTPVYTGATTAGTSPTGVGFYTKVGQLVTVTCGFKNVAASGAGGVIQITGLPFLSKDTANYEAHGSVSCTSAISVSPLTATILNNVNYIRLRGANTTVYTNVQNTSGIYIFTTISYETN